MNDIETRTAYQYMEEIFTKQTIDKESKQKTKENIDDIKAKVEKIEQKIN